MKKVILVIAFLLILSLLCACNNQKDESFIPAETTTFVSNLDEMKNISQDSDAFSKRFEKIKNKLSDKYPVITNSNVNKYLNDVEKECKKLKKDNIILSYERVDNSLLIVTTTGISFVFEPQIEESLENN